jgi:hypothetical protein
MDDREECKLQKENDASSVEECEWCDSTGDVEKNRKLYWMTVLLIVLFILFLYVLSFLW